MKNKYLGYLTDGDYLHTVRGTIEAIQAAAMAEKTSYIIREDRVIFFPEVDTIIERGDYRK